MSNQPGQGPLVPAIIPIEGEADVDEQTRDEGVPVGDADVEADRQNASEDGDASPGTDSASS